MNFFNATSSRRTKVIASVGILALIASAALIPTQAASASSIDHAKTRYTACDYYNDHEVCLTATLTRKSRHKFVLNSYSITAFGSGSQNGMKRCDHRTYDSSPSVSNRGLHGSAGPSEISMKQGNLTWGNNCYVSASPNKTLTYAEGTQSVSLSFPYRAHLLGQTNRSATLGIQVRTGGAGCTSSAAHTFSYDLKCSYAHV